MDLDECKHLLYQHAGLRMPVFSRDIHGPEPPASATQKIERLEDYLGEVAVARGNLEEARLWADHVRFTLDDDWEKVEGWQQFVEKPSKATGPQIAQAKRQVRPDLYDAIREAKWVVARLTDQIKRLEKDEENASRRYTLIVGS